MLACVKNENRRAHLINIHEIVAKRPNSVAKHRCLSLEFCKTMELTLHMAVVELQGVNPTSYRSDIVLEWIEIPHKVSG